MSFSSDMASNCSLRCAMLACSSLSLAVVSDNDTDIESFSCKRFSSLILRSVPSDTSFS